MSVSRKRGADKSVELDGELAQKEQRMWKDDRFTQTGRELKVIQEATKGIMDNGPFRLVRHSIMGEPTVGGKPSIAFSHKCDLSSKRETGIGKRSLDVGIGQLTFVLRTWGDLDNFIDQVLDVFTKLDDNPNHPFYEEIFKFIDGIITELAEKHQKLFELSNVSNSPDPTPQEQALYDELAAAFDKARKAGILTAVLHVGDASDAAVPMSEDDIYRSRCRVCGNSTPYNSYDPDWKQAVPDHFIPTSPSYSPTWDD